MARLYQRWRAKHQFLLQGRVVLGPACDNGWRVTLWLLLLGLPTLYFVFVFSLPLKELRTLTVVGTAFFLTFVTTTAVLLWACMTMDPGIVMPGYARKLLLEGESVEAIEEDAPQAAARNNDALPALKLGFEAGQEGLGDPDAHGDAEQRQSEVVSKRLDMLFDGSAAAALDALGPVAGLHEWHSHPLEEGGGGDGGKKGSGVGGGWGSTMLARRLSRSGSKQKIAEADGSEVTGASSHRRVPSDASDILAAKALAQAAPASPSKRQYATKAWASPPPAQQQAEAVVTPSFGGWGAKFLASPGSPPLHQLGGEDEAQQSTRAPTTEAWASPALLDDAATGAGPVCEAAQAGFTARDDGGDGGAAIAALHDAVFTRNDAGATALASFSSAFLNNDDGPPPPSELRAGEVWCHTCSATRPKGGHHCGLCGVCVSAFDHHCAILGSCIAGRNHRPFVALLFAAALSLFTLFGLSLTQVVLLFHARRLRNLRDFSQTDLGLLMAATVLVGALLWTRIVTMFFFVRWRETIFYVHLLVAVLFGLVGLKRWYRDQQDFLTYNPFGLLLAVNALPAAVSLLWFGLYHVNNLRTSQTTKKRLAEYKRREARLRRGRRFQHDSGLGVTVNPATQITNPMARASPMIGKQGAPIGPEDVTEPCFGAMCLQWDAPDDHEPVQGLQFWEILLSPLPPSEVRFRQSIPKVYGGV